MNELRVHQFKGLITKKKLFETVAKFLSEGEGPTFSRILDSLNARERLGSTCIGKGIAIPHCKLAIDSPRAVILILDEAVKYADECMPDVDIVFGLLVPEDNSDQHLHILSSIANLCEREGWLEGLRSLATEQDIINYLTTGASSLDASLVDIL